MRRYLLTKSHENNRVVNFNSKGKNLVGKFIDLRIVEVKPNSLRGMMS